MPSFHCIQFAIPVLFILFFFFLNDTAPPEFYPLPLHDALPILLKRACTGDECAMLLELPAAAVRDFIHAAYLCGYAQLQAAPAVALSAGAAGTDNGLLARLWRHLRGSERNA